MPLYHAVYHSRRVNRDADELADILTVAQARNRAVDVTGVLLVEGEFFIQVLEGGRRALTDIFARILNDPRHTDIELTMFEEASERVFTDWSMTNIEIGSVARKHLADAGMPAVPHPADMSGELIWDLVLTIAGQTKDAGGLLQSA